MTDEETLMRNRAAPAAALLVAPDVDGVLDGGGVRGPGLVGRQRRVAHHLTAGAVVDGDQHGVGPGTLVLPGELVLERAGDQVEGDRGLEHLGVVDGPDRLGVAVGDGADRDARIARAHRAEHGISAPPAPGRRGGAAVPGVKAQRRHASKDRLSIGP